MLYLIVGKNSYVAEQELAKITQHAPVPAEHVDTQQLDAAGLAELGLEPLNGRERIAFISLQSLAFLEILTPVPERPAPFPRDRRTRSQNQARRQNAYMTV